MRASTTDVTLHQDLSLRLKRAARRAVSKLPPPRDEAALTTVRALRALATGRLPQLSHGAIVAAGAPTVTSDGALGMTSVGDSVGLTVSQLERAYAAGDDAEIRDALKRLHDLIRTAEDLAKPASIPADERLATTRGVASTQYTIDLLPHLQKAFEAHDRWARLSLLDVGPGTGHGTALLARLYATSRLGYRLDVTALDIDPRYQRYLEVIAPTVDFVHADVFDHDETYDYAVASHVIEHVPEVKPITRRLQEITRHAVFLVAPYEEPEDRLTRGHVRSIDAELVDALDPTEVTVYRSPAWGAFMDPPYESVIIRLPGLASRDT